MTVTKDKSDLETLASNELTELFGWPVWLLDELRALEDRADSGRIDIHEWRRRDAQLRANSPDHTPLDQVRAAHQAAVQAWVGASARARAKRLRMQQLATRLRAIMHGAPDDQALLEQLARFDLLMSRERDYNLRERLRMRQRLVAQWLTASGQYDKVTGLPWELLLRYRWIPDPVLGQVPAYLGIARTHALAEAAEETARLARQLRPEGRSGMSCVPDEIDQLALTNFPRRVIEMGALKREHQDLADQLLRLWQAPAMQAFLLQETARGWPERAVGKDLLRGPVALSGVAAAAWRLSGVASAA